MPYILLTIGLLIGAYALYRFFLNANVQQIKALFLSALLLALCIALFYMAVTGRLAAAIALIVAMAPVAMGLVRYWRAAKAPSETKHSVDSLEEAYEILGLKEDARKEDVQAAYKKLMQKVHPDQDGSEWMAAKLNQARDIVLAHLKS